MKLSSFSRAVAARVLVADRSFHTCAHHHEEGTVYSREYCIQGTFRGLESVTDLLVIALFREGHRTLNETTKHFEARPVR